MPGAPRTVCRQCVAGPGTRASAGAETGLRTLAVPAPWPPACSSSAVRKHLSVPKPRSVCPERQLGLTCRSVPDRGTRPALCIPTPSRKGSDAGVSSNGVHTEVDPQSSNRVVQGRPYSHTLKYYLYFPRVCNKDMKFQKQTL